MPSTIIVVNPKNKYGWTPLYYAAQYNATETADLLLDRGADVNAKGNYGSTPLYYAEWLDSTEIEKLLRVHNGYR